MVDRLAYLRRSRGIWGTFRRAFAQAVSPLCKVTDYHIHMLYFQSGFDVDEKWPDDDDMGTHSVAVESVEELEEFSNEIDDHFDLEEWRNFLTGSSKRFLVLSRRPREGGACKVIGVFTCEIGVFSIWEGGRQIELSDHIMMFHDTEVHPQYRGQRVSRIARKGLYAYCMKKNVDRTVGVIGSQNLSSLKAHTKGSEMVQSATKGRIRRVRLLGGLIDRMTPADEIKALIEAPPADFDK